ncbi:MAG: hypothetical protein GC172_11865 [Phycisphaera sp.]|nr:hypothetical protein [Phycisphaera sp.]
MTSAAAFSRLIANPRMLALAFAALLSAMPIAEQASAQSKGEKEILRTADRDAEIPRSEDAKDGERLMLEIANGRLRLRTDAKAESTRISAVFTVDGVDAADAERRTKLVRLYAERADEGTIIVGAYFPGTAMPRDSVELEVTAPPAKEAVLKSTDGVVEARGTTGKLRMITRNGEVIVSDHAGTVDARAVNGRILVEGATDSVQAKSTNGPVQIVLADGNDNPFTLEARNGAVIVEVASDFDGVVTMLTANGRLGVVDPAKLVRVSEISSTRLVAEIGEAQGQSTIATSNGAITLVRRAGPKADAAGPATGKPDTTRE